MSHLLSTLSFLIVMAYMTMWERKILGLAQVRLGPETPSFLGILLPMFDMVKLITKKNTSPYMANKIQFLLTPMMFLLITLSLILIVPFKNLNNNQSYSILTMTMLLTVKTFPFTILGWISKSKYSMISSMRTVAQMISYEPVMMLSLFTIMILNSKTSMNVENSWITQKLITWPILPLWMMALMAEVNRSPFDFSESESELVSGFNIEFSGAMFTSLFVSEYMIMVLMSMITSLLFLSFNTFTLILLSSTMMFLFLMSRASVPRMRYDKLMMTAWKISIPLVMNFFIYYLMIKMANL